MKRSLTPFQKKNKKTKKHNQLDRSHKNNPHGSI